MEKFFDIVCRFGDLTPSASTIRASTPSRAAARSRPGAAMP